MPGKRSSKIEDEVREILERADWDDEPETPERQPTPIRSGWRRYRPTAPKVQISPDRSLLNRIPKGARWLGGTFALAFSAWLISDWSTTIATILVIIALIVFFSPIFMQFRGMQGMSGGPPPPPVQEKKWRGRVIQMPPNRSGVGGELRHRWWKFRNRQ